MAVSMHGNLRPPNVAPVVRGFNYEAHNAPSYKFKKFATSSDPECIDVLNFSEIEYIHGVVIAI